MKYSRDKSRGVECSAKEIVALEKIRWKKGNVRGEKKKERNINIKEIRAYNKMTRLGYSKKHNCRCKQNGKNRIKEKRVE